MRKILGLILGASLALAVALPLLTQSFVESNRAVEFVLDKMERAGLGVTRADAQGFNLDSPTILGRPRAGNSPTLAPPTISGGTLTAGSTDLVGQITATSSAAITLTFSGTWSTAPFCQLNNISVNTSGIVHTTTTTTLVTTGSGGYAATNKINYLCWAAP